MRFLPLLLIFVLLAGCQPSPQYQKHVTVPAKGWSYNFQPQFRIEIKDTTAAYRLFFIIRHTNAYPFSNIWLRLRTKGPGETQFKEERFEVTLASPTAVLPDGSLSGGWLGRGMGQVWEQRMPLVTKQQPLTFSKPGIYTFRLAQDMRLNPLPEIIQVGLRMENMGQATPQNQDKQAAVKP